MDHPIDRTIGQEASASNHGHLRGVDRDPQQTLIIRDAPRVDVLHPLTPHGAGVGLTAPRAEVQAHTAGGAEMATRGGDILGHDPSLAAPTAVGDRVPTLQVDPGSEGEAGPGASPPVSAEVEVAVLLQVRGTTVVQYIACQPALGRIYLRPQRCGSFGNVRQVPRECESGAQ